MLGRRQRLEQIAGVCGTPEEADTAERAVVDASDLTLCLVCKKQKLNVKVRRRADLDNDRGARSGKVHFADTRWEDLMQATYEELQLGHPGTPFLQAFIVKSLGNPTLPF